MLTKKSALLVTAVALLVVCCTADDPSTNLPGGNRGNTGVTAQTDTTAARANGTPTETRADGGAADARASLDAQGLGIDAQGPGTDAQAPAPDTLSPGDALTCVDGTLCNVTPTLHGICHSNMCCPVGFNRVTMTCNPT